MPRKNHKTSWFRFNLAVIFSLSSSVFLGSYSLPISALEIPQYLRKFIIAKPPDERQPEAVEQGIEQIPTPQPSVAPQPSQPIDSPIPPSSLPPTTTNTVPAPAPAPTPRPSRPVNTAPAPRPSRPVQPRTNSQPTRQPSPISPLGNVNYKPINFVDFAFGILGRGDFQSQGRYFHFYQFEGRENQLIQIRLGGSADTRRSNNLSLNPYMFLLDPNNNVIVKRGSTQASNGIKDAFVFVRLPVEGTYTIAVTSRNPGDTGRYSLALRNDRASYAVDASGELTAQSLTLKQNKSPYDVSKFEGKKDQLVSIRADSVFEEFSPYLVLLDSQGKIVATDNANDGKYSALIDRARLPGDGTYYVIVSSANPPERGRYRLTLY